MKPAHQVCIRGDGITGCTLALQLASQGLRVALLGAGSQADAGVSDVRAYSLNAGSRQLLQTLNAWPDDTAVQSVLKMSVWGDDGGHIEFGGRSGALSWIVDVAALQERLRQRVIEQNWIVRTSEPVPAPLTVLCEGRHSATRRAWGLHMQRHLYEQTALAFRIRHDLPHQACARQWFAGLGRHASILAFLPLADAHSSAVVWSLPHETAQQRLLLAPEELMQALQLASQHALGSTELISERACWPLQSAQAGQWSGALAEGGMFALVGDAAHSIHPLAGLGLNLGLEDAAALARHLQNWQGPAELHVGDLRAYERERKLALKAVNTVCDGLQTLFAHPSPLARWLRNSGFSGFNRMEFLKQWVMTQTSMEIAA